MPWNESLRNTIIAQALLHLAAGVALALGDRLLSKPRPTSLKERLQARLDALKILAYLTRLEQGEEVEHPPPDRGEIDEACRYLRHRLRSGELRLGDEATPGPPATGFESTAPGGAAASGPAPASGQQRSAWERLLFWLQHEKINPRRPMTKLKVGYALEILADGVVALSAAFWGRGNALGAIGHSLYQGLAMAIGLIVGGFFFGRRDHRAPRRLRKGVARLEERLGRDAHAMELLTRIGRGETPRLPAATAAASPDPSPTGGNPRHAS